MAQKLEAPRKPRVSTAYQAPKDSNVRTERAGAFIARKMFEFGRFALEDRAIPDFRDGHKPVHRRLLFSLHDLQPSPTGNYLKVARVTGDCMGRFHPHASAAGPLVNLTYERYPLVVGQGNFGSIKGDKPAAERYIECRSSQLTRAHFACEQVMETVDNYSGEFQEPLVINTRVPLLMINGGSGTAVGYVTKIPSNNMVEVCQALEYVARNWKTADAGGLAEIVKGPDFAFGGVMLSGKDEVAALYRDGFGKLRFSCDYKIEAHPTYSSVTNVVVHGFPDPFNIKQFVEKTIVQMKKLRVIVGYTEYYDKKTGELRLVVSVDNTASLKKVLSALQCASTYRINVTERKSDDESGTEFIEHLPMIDLMKRWLLWRKSEEEKMMRLALEKLAVSKFKEDCKLQAMLNIEALTDAVRQLKIPAIDYVVKVLHVTEDQAKEMLHFRLDELTRCDEKKLREHIKGIEAEIAKIQKDLQNAMAVVVRHLQELAKDHGDARRTRVNARMHDERKMQQTGDPLAFAVTEDGKLLGVIDEKGTTSSRVHVSPSYEGHAVFGSAGVVSFFGASDVGKAGIGFDAVVGSASREAPMLFCIGSNGFYNLAEQARDSNKTIPTFIKETTVIFGAGAWPGSKVLLWGKDKSRSVKIADLKCMRKNVKGIKLPGVVEAAMIVHPWQDVVDAEGNAVSARATIESPDGIFVIGARNLLVMSSGRRKIADKAQTIAHIARGDVATVHDLTLPKES